MRGANVDVIISKIVFIDGNELLISLFRWAGTKLRDLCDIDQRKMVTNIPISQDSDRSICYNMNSERKVQYFENEI